jgi:hypothetical protein
LALDVSIAAMMPVINETVENFWTAKIAQLSSLTSNSILVDLLNLLGNTVLLVLIFILFLVWSQTGVEVSEAARIEEEVRKRKKIAEDKGVKDLITRLYFDYLEYFPSWIKNHNDHVPSLIDSAISEKKGEKEITIISFKDKKYRFDFSQHSFYAFDEYCTHGLLELFSEDKKLVAINLSEVYSEYGGSDWRPFGVEAFIDGKWIDDFKYLKGAIQKNEELREKKMAMANEPKRIKKLKDDYGIE